MVRASGESLDPGVELDLHLPQIAQHLERIASTVLVDELVLLAEHEATRKLHLYRLTAAVAVPAHRVLARVRARCRLQIERQLLHCLSSRRITITTITTTTTAYR